MNLKPPAESVYNIPEDLITAVNKHAGPQKYAVIKCHSKKYLKDDLIHKVIFWCDWGDKYIVTVNDAYWKRWTSDTQLQKCPYWVNALWKDFKHNHNFTIKFSHSALRKLNPNIQKTVVKQSAAEITFEWIVTALWNINHLMPLIKHNIYNAKTHLRRKALLTHLYSDLNADPQWQLHLHLHKKLSESSSKSFLCT